jgi:ABC-type glycerol-3-phosphate transport system substrate-binding protein
MGKTSMRVLVIVMSAMLLIAGCRSSDGASDAKGTPGQAGTSAANASATPAGDQKAPVKLKLAHGWTGEVPMAAAFEPAVERFIAENNYITLTVETAPGNGIREKIVTEMAANAPPDVFLHWGVRDTANYIVNDRLADLTDLIAQDPEMQGRYIDNAYVSSTYQNRIYGLPIEAYMMTFLVNERMFQEHGVKIPETFGELKEAVTAFKKKNLVPIAANDGTTRAMLTNLADQVYGDSLNDKLAGKEPYGQGLTRVAQLANELIELGAFPKGMETMGTLQALEMFNAEMAPMYFQHSWTLGNIGKEIIDQVRVIPFPKIEEAQQPYLTAGVGYFVYISKQAYADEQKREAAWKLAKYLAGPEVGKDLEEIAGNPSPVKLERGAGIHPVLAKALELRDSGKVKVFPDHNDLLSSEASAAYNDLKTRLYLKDITPDQYAQRFQQAISTHPNKAFE